MVYCKGRRKRKKDKREKEKKRETKISETKCRNDVNNQHDATNFSFINIFNKALHVSGDKFAHPRSIL